MHILPLRNLIKADGIQEVSGSILYILKNILPPIWQLFVLVPLH